jgi:hypothetical protein
MVDEVAYRRFLANAPYSQRELRTIELYHPAFNQVYRFVREQEDQQLALEASAPRNAGETVTFTALAMQITEPGEEANADPVLIVQLGAVGGEVNAELDGFTPSDFLTEVEIVYRKYFSGDLSEPAVIISETVTGLTFTGADQVGFTGEGVDLTNKRAGRVYTLEEFPALKRL